MWNKITVLRKYHATKEIKLRIVKQKKTNRCLIRINYSDIVSTINALDENSEQKVLGFIHLYDYILKSTDDDYELIDQLFFVPGRFEREFQQRK